VTALIVTYTLILLSMAARDCLGTLSTAAIVHGRKVLAGFFDGTCDIAAVISITATGAVTLEHGLHAATFMAFAALFVGSLVGTYGGMTIADALEHRFGRAIPAAGVVA